MFGRAKERGERLEIRFEMLERRLASELGYEVGSYTLTRSGEDGPRVSRGKFSVVYLRAPDQGWRIHVDSSSDLPVSD